MPAPADPDELALVIKALTCGVRGCVEWKRNVDDRIRSDPFLKGLTPEGIQEDAIAFVKKNSDKVIQVSETRPQYDHRAFYYKVIIPYPELFRRGLFVEMELYDSDPEVPTVLLVNAHEQNY
jgi:hypothetical protein